jgi:hypothetical protein
MLICLFFASRKAIDANVTEKDSISEEILSVSSLQNTGYHTTPSELEDKDAIKETIMGANITYNSEQFKIGLTYINYMFDADLGGIFPVYKFELSSIKIQILGLITSLC